MLRLDELKDLDKGKRGHFPYGLNGNESGGAVDSLQRLICSLLLPPLYYLL